jgi:hypothetical protein
MQYTNLRVMADAYILHTTADAKDFVEKYYSGNEYIFSTNPCVNVYLETQHGIKCRCLSEFIDDEEQRALFNLSIDKTNTILSRMDEHSSIIFKDVTPANYFSALYSYFGSLLYHALMCFKLALVRAREQNSFGEVYIYDHILKLLGNDIHISDVLNNDQNNVKEKINYLTSHQESHHRGTVLIDQLSLVSFKYVMKYTVYFRIIALVRKLLNSKSKKNILFQCNYYELEFLHTRLWKYNIIIYDGINLPLLRKEGKRCTEECVRNIDRYLNGLFADGPMSDCDRLFTEFVINHFQSNYTTIYNALIEGEQFLSTQAVSLVLWDMPPAKNNKAVIIELLKTRGVPVIGMQHGNGYGEMYYPFHFLSDFNRCSHYLSYGFREDDLTKLYGKGISSRIYPVGKIKINEAHKKVPSQIDILYPITNTINMFEGGMTRSAPDRLHSMQVEILSYLNSLEQQKICIKPPMNANEESLAVYSMFKKLKDHIGVTYNRSLTSYLQEYNPAITIIDYPSTPLIEVISRDTEIFMLVDNVCYYNDRILKLLEKRVHVSDSVGELILKMNNFLAGKLKSKRNNDYYNTYVAKENSKEAIIRIIDGIMKNTNEKLVKTKMQNIGIHGN